MTRKRYERTVHRAFGPGAGHIATIFDSSMPENVFDPAGGRWVLVCEAHSQLVNVSTLQAASDFANELSSWCDGGEHPSDLPR